MDDIHCSQTWLAIFLLKAIAFLNNDMVLFIKADDLHHLKRDLFITSDV